MTNHSKIHRLPGAASGQRSALERRLGPIDYQPVAALAAYDNNPRQHSEVQIIKLMNSIREFGFALPVLVDTRGTIIAGHARIEAARRLGMAEAPVLVARDWSKAQVRAYRLADNRLAELATWDDALLAIELSAIIELDAVPVELLGWETGEIDLITKDHSTFSNAADPADAPAEPANPVSRPGDLWLLGGHRLLCGSSPEPASGQRLTHIDVAVRRWSEISGEDALLAETGETFDAVAKRRADRPAADEGAQTTGKLD